jgi:membrane fusion protein, heavy metal efflux system
MFRSIPRELLFAGIAILAASAAARAQEAGGSQAAPPATTAQGEAIRADQVASNSSSGQAREQSLVAGRAPLLTKEGQRIVVPEGSPLRSELMIAVVTVRQIRRALELPAVVEADPARTVKVLPPTAGRVVDLKVQLGDRVVQQQELAVIHVGDLAHTDFDNRKALAIASVTGKLIGDRESGFEGSGGGTAADRQRKEVQSARQGAQLRALSAPPDGIPGTRLLSLKAPVAGSVIDLPTAPGAAVEDLSASLLTIANLETIWVTTNVPRKDAASITTERTVQIGFVAYPGEVLNGEARVIGNTDNADASKIKVRIEFSNPDMRFKPNMSAVATFFGPSETVSTVPTAAVISKKQSNKVLLEIAPWIFEIRPIEVSSQQGDRTIVTSGLKAGDRVVMGGALLVESQ